MNLSQRGPRRSSRRSTLNMISYQDLDTTSGVNCFIDLPKQVFSLTYLQDNVTQNPDSLEILEGLRKKTWQIYLVGYLYNFDYQKSQINSLNKALNDALNAEVPSNHNLKYFSEVVVTDEFSPTENDNNAIVITVNEVNETIENNKQVFKGYLMSWCNPVTASSTLLPLMLCNGRKMVRLAVLEVLCKRFDVIPHPFNLMREDLLHLSLYSLIMLGENDCGVAKLYYKIPPGTIKLSVPLSDMISLWNHIHEEDSDEVDLDEVIKFHNAVEFFCETTFGFKLNSAHFQQIEVDGYFTLRSNSEIWSSSTKIIHVMLKYITYLAVERLKVKTFERIHKSS